MKKSLLGVLVIGLLVAAEGKPKVGDPAVTVDPKAILKGAWEVVEIDEGGKKAPEERSKGNILTFEGDNVTFKRMDTTEKGTYKIDASKKPAHIDIKPEKEDEMKMIYQLDGDTLKIAGTMNGKERPKGFDDKNLMIITLKRVKK